MNTLQKICTKIVERCDFHHYKGKKREDMSYEFMCGAWAALDAIGHKDAQHVGSVMAMVISVRGYKEIELIARQGAEADKDNVREVGAG